MIHSLQNGKCVEIPVNYKSRIGTSKITGDIINAFKLGIRMIILIIKYRIFPSFLKEQSSQKY